MTLRCRVWGAPIKVRLYCIDAPELKQEPWGMRSRDHLRQIAGERVRLRAVQTDKYGRTVGEVYRAADDASLNVAMVSAGHAAVYARYCGEERFKLAERVSRANQWGIWSRPGLHQEPWTFRHNK